MTTDFSTPVLDTISMASFSTPEALAEALHRACTIDGFIYVKDHGITQAEIDAVFGLSADFFTNAPESEKSFVNLKENVGYTAVRQEALDSTMPGSGDLKEHYHVSDLEWDKANDVHHELPPTLERRRQQLDGLIRKINAIAKRLLEGLAVALKLPPDYLTRQHTGELNRLRMIHYPPVEVDHKDLDPDVPDIRAGAHTDYGSITILFQHKVSGLQVLRGDTWLDVPPQEGCLVINIGDALEFWSAGLFKSTLHRVVMPRVQAETASRFTIAYFVHADTDSVLEPFVQDNGNEALLEQINRRKGLPVGTRRITGGDYVKARLHATYHTTNV